MKSLRSEAGNIARSGAALLSFAAMMGLLAGCMTAPPHPLVGSWAIEVDAGGQTLLQTLTVIRDLTGVFTVADSESTFPITDLMLEGNSVSFKVVFDFQGQELPVTFTGTVEGDVLTGEYDTQLGPAPMTGKRI